MIHLPEDMVRIGIMLLWAKWLKDQKIRILWFSIMVGLVSNIPSPRTGIDPPRILISLKIKRIRIWRKYICKDSIVEIRVGIKIDIECIYYLLHLYIYYLLN